MDGPDLLLARGLPCFFDNPKDAAGETVQFIAENNSLVFARQSFKQIQQNKYV